MPCPLSIPRNGVSVKIQNADDLTFLPSHLPCICSPPQLHAGLLEQRLGIGSYFAVKNVWDESCWPARGMLPLYWGHGKITARPGSTFELRARLSRPGSDLLTTRLSTQKASSVQSNLCKLYEDNYWTSGRSLEKSGISHLSTGCCIINSRLHSAVTKSIDLGARLLCFQFQLIITTTSFVALGKLFNCSPSAKQGLTIAPTS